VVTEVERQSPGLDFHFGSPEQMIQAGRKGYVSVLLDP
jgi:hypothetical protein